MSSSSNRKTSGTQRPSPSSSDAATLSATTRNVTLAAGTGPLQGAAFAPAPVKGPQLAPLIGAQLGIPAGQGKMPTLEPGSQASGPGDTVRKVVREKRDVHEDTDVKEEEE